MSLDSTLSRMLYMFCFDMFCNILRSTDVAKDVLCFNKNSNAASVMNYSPCTPKSNQKLTHLMSIYAYIFHGLGFTYIFHDLWCRSLYVHILNLFSRLCGCDRFSLVHTQCPSYGGVPCISCVSRPRTWSSLWKLSCQFKRAAARLLWVGRCIELRTNEGWTKRVYFISV